MFLRTKESSSRPRTAAIIPAAGSSTRMGTNKLLLPLAGVPVLARTLLAFEQSPWIDDIIIVCREQDIVPYGKLARDFSCAKVRQIVRGGQTRSESVLAGLCVCDPEVTFVAIHDGARPLIAQAVIAQAIETVLTCDAAAPIVALKDSIKRVSDGKIVADVARESIAAVQTPQCFRKSLISAALKEAIAAGASLTDDCAAVERMGISVTAVPGSYRNLKITTPEDIAMAESLLSQED